jgi:hypothetical protein
MSKRVNGIRKVRTRSNGPKPPNGAGLLTSAGLARKLERQYQVLELRKAGHTIKEIADLLKVGTSVIHGDLVEVLNYTLKDLTINAEQDREMQVQRLDGLLQRYYPLAKAGNLAAAAMVLQIETRRAKLLSLDVPETKRIEATGIREYVGIALEDV